jgi:hypothetical protein
VSAARNRCAASIALRLNLVLLVALGLAQPAGAAGPSWRQLHRPLHLPQLGAGEECPVSPVDRRVDWEKHPIFGESGTGPGPVYPGLGSSGGDLTIRGPSSDGWFRGKVFWYVKPSYRKRVLIRGRRLDAPGPVHIRASAAPRSSPRELRIKRKTTVSWRGKPRRSRGVPSGVYVPASGCYGAQVDGSRFSRVVVFTASAP